ncbi:MAG: TonB-dependent receptor [Rhodanobacter sp.]
MKLTKRILPVAMLSALMGLPVTSFAGQTSPAGDKAAQASSSTENSQAETGEKKAKNLSAVMVTGSHIRRVDLETANPVLTVGHEQIMATGDMTLGQLVQDLSVMTGGATNQQYAHNHGGTQLSMRGLGSARTLILVDGRRVISKDVNSIPAAMIERIEVLKNGASAVYGSDAIGGVVNFITKKHYQGAQFTARLGESAHADARGKSYTFTFGQTTDKGSIIGGVGYNKTDGVSSSTRPFTRDILDLGTNSHGVPEVSVGGSTNSPYGNIQIPKSGGVHDAFGDCSSGYLARNPSASGMDPVNDYHCYQNSGSNSDKYNFASETQLLKPQERTNAFVMGTYNLGSHTSVYLDAYYNKTTSAFEEAPTTYHTPQITISADNYYNPFGVEFGSKGYHFRSRLTAMGNRGEKYDTTTEQISTGIKGTFSAFDRGWDWDVGMSYGHTSANTLTLNYPNLSGLYTGPSFLDPASGTVTCGTPGKPVAGCDATFNPFNVQSANSAAVELANSVPAIENSYDQEKSWHAQASGGLFDLPAGTVQLAVGADYRQEHTHSVLGSLLLIDPDTGNCGLGTHCSAPLQGGYNVKEGYGELFVPILADLPGAYGLNVTIGDRYSRFSSFGSSNNKEFKVEWRPIQSLLLRGSMEEVFRAPTVADVYTSVSTANPRITSDPCDGYTGSPANPACVNVPTDGSFVNALVAQNVASAIVTSGSRYAGFPIKPETGKSFDLGLVYSPSRVPGLTVSGDVWHVYLNNLITSVNLQNMLNLCSDGQTAYCSLIQRYPSGPQQGQISQQTVEPIGNLGSLSTGGVDVSADYKLATDSIGRFDFNVSGSYLKYYTAQTAPGTSANTTYQYAGHYMGAGSAPASDCPGVGQCLFPRWRANGIARWNMGNWHATWKVRYIGDFRMGSPVASQDTFPAGSGLDGYFIDYGSNLYHNVSLSYDIKSLHTRLTAGVNNLFDNQPPVLYDNNAAYNVDQQNFDLIGRYYWARVVVSF